MTGLTSAIDRSSPIPYYVQVMDALRERITGGAWRAGEQLPGEMELCGLFEVSRPVVRQALQELMREGLIVREKGRGTFVAEPKISGSLVQRLTGFYEDMVNQGLTPVSQILKQAVVAASPKVAGFLEIAPETEVVEVQRLRFVHEEPIVLVTTYVPYALCPSLLEADLTNQSLYAYLEETCGLIVARGRRAIEAVGANEFEARHFNLKKGTPLILLDSVSYDRSGTPVEYYHALHRGDRTRFEVELVRVRQQGEETAPLFGLSIAGELAQDE